MKRVAFLAGARPNYMKVFPIWKALQRSRLPVQPVLIHTGQHYDEAMSDVFFRDFNMEKPTHFLGVGSGPHGLQTARVMTALEELFTRERPDVLVVVGDVNSTMAGALVAVKMHIPTVHVEAGLRSLDRNMPEEINRIVTDAISDLLLLSCRDAEPNLLREGITPEKIKFVGNVMIDSLVQLLPQASSSPLPRDLGVSDGPFILTTLHRPSNVDDPSRLRLLMDALQALASSVPVVFPVHPRTRKMLEKAELGTSRANFIFTEPLGYNDFLSLESRAALVITDSGGVQEETSYLGIPCLTLRLSTERPVTVTEGTNRLLDPERESLSQAAREALSRGRRQGPCPIEGWDGRAAERIVAALKQFAGM